jgi:flagellin-specific chaperone FliS
MDNTNEIKTILDKLADIAGELEVIRDREQSEEISSEIHSAMECIDEIIVKLADGIGITSS